MLLGSQTIQGSVDSNPDGMAEAFGYVAAASGTVSRLSVYVDSGSTATKLIVGLYSSTSSNTPGKLLTQGSMVLPVAGAWNSVSVPAAQVVAGRKYWIAVLAPAGSGTLQFRDLPNGSGGKNQTSAQTNLTTLPATWSAGTTYWNAPMSAFAS